MRVLGYPHSALVVLKLLYECIHRLIHISPVSSHLILGGEEQPKKSRFVLGEKDDENSHRLTKRQDHMLSQRVYHENFLHPPNAYTLHARVSTMIYTHASDTEA